MKEIILKIADAAVPVFCLLITAGGAYLVALLRKRTAQIEKELDNENASKYINMACDAVAQAVTYTAQTFVDALKAEGAFTKEKQLEAFETAKYKTLEILGDTTVKALREIYGDFDTWLATKIEQNCRELKTTNTDGSVLLLTPATDEQSGEAETETPTPPIGEAILPTFLNGSYN